MTDAREPREKERPAQSGSYKPQAKERQDEQGGRESEAKERQAQRDNRGWKVGERPAQQDSRELRTEQRQRIADRAGFTGIICNVFLFALKLAVGLMTASVSVLADAFNNLTDAGSSIISVVGSRMAGKEADEDHPFGHGRIEYIAAFIVACLVIQVGISVLREAFHKVLHPEPLQFSYLSLGLLSASIAVKLWMSFYYRKIGRKIDSKVYTAAASDSLGDVLTSASTVISLLIFRFLQWNLDGWIGLLVSALVIYNGVMIAKDTLEPLIGESIDPKLYYQIQDFVCAYDGIEGSHDLIVHNYGPNQYMASIHAEVSKDVDIESIHEVIDRIERDIRDELGIYLVIHMDPVDTSDARIQAYRDMIGSYVEALDPALSFHDFRVVHGEKHSNLVFDLVTPWEYTEEQQYALMHELCAQVKAAHPQLSCVITAEKSFMHEHKDED